MRKLSTLLLSTIALTMAVGCTKKAPLAAVRPTTPVPTQETQVARSEAAPPPARQEQASAAPSANTDSSGRPLEKLLNQFLDAYFDYNEATLRNDAMTTLTQNSDRLRTMLAAYPNAKFLVDGNCDERGSSEYNLALGDRRAHAAKEFLVQVGVPSERLATISYGKERPTCGEHTEACWQMNRRAHLVELP